MTTQPFVCYGKNTYIFGRQNELFESNPILIKNKNTQTYYKHFANYKRGNCSRK